MHAKLHISTRNQITFPREHRLKANKQRNTSSYFLLQTDTMPHYKNQRFVFIVQSKTTTTKPFSPKQVGVG
jgi:hypothetical protein